MGLHDLDKSFRDLLEMHGYRAYFAGHHGDGVGVAEANHRGSGVTAMPQPGDCPAREVTNDEFEAFKWKCSLHKMPAPMIKDMSW